MEAQSQSFGSYMRTEFLTKNCCDIVQLVDQLRLTMDITFTLNGRPVRIDVSSTTILVHDIRQNLRLTESHVGCDTAQCGGCTVHVKGQAVKSCSRHTAQAEGLQLTKIEGSAPADQIHPMQAAFKACHGLQRGFCTPGVIVSAIELCARHPDSQERGVPELLDGNIEGDGAQPVASGETLRASRRLRSTSPAQIADLGAGYWTGAHGTHRLCRGQRRVDNGVLHGLRHATRCRLGNDSHAQPSCCDREPSGAKGAVEAMPAVMNAVGNVPSTVGVKHSDILALPCRIWEAIQADRSNKSIS